MGDRRAVAVQPAGSWSLLDVIGSVTLDWDHRHRRRIKLSLDRGRGELLLDLPQTAVLRDGDGLVLEGGGIVAIRAKPEPVCDIRCASAEELARIAWHLGNRHLPVEVLPGRLRIRDDHVIVAMLEGLGAAVTRTEASFTPEGGAYDQTHGHGHADEHAHGHHHHHDHDDHH